MSYTNHLFNLPTSLLRLFRQLENTRKKICKAEWSTIFNNVCLQENIRQYIEFIRTTDKSKTMHYLKCFIIKQLNIIENLIIHIE